MRGRLISAFPKMFPSELHTLKTTRDLIIAGLTRMHLWPVWITPNRLSMLRMWTIVPVAALMLSGFNLEALWLFIAGTVCDWFDGPLARLRDGLHRPSKRRQEGVTGFGSYLDAMADKIIVVGVCITTLYIIFARLTSPLAESASSDLLYQSIYTWLHTALLCETVALESWSAVKRTIDYRGFRKGIVPITRLHSTEEGKYKAFLQFIATGGYVLAAPWSLLVGLTFLAGSSALTVKSLWAKYRCAP